MKVIKGISKGKTQTSKDLRNELESVKNRLAFKEKIWNEYLDDERPYLFEIEKLLGVLISFIPQSNTSQRLYTKQDKKLIENAKTDKEKHAIALKISERIGNSDEAHADLNANTVLWKKWESSSPVEKVKFLLEVLTKSESGKSPIERYRSFFGSKFRPTDTEEIRDQKPTTLEIKLYNFCIKNRIDLMDSIGRVHLEAQDRGFRNLKGKKKLHRSTVGKMLAKYRPQ